MKDGKWTYNYITDDERWNCEDEFDTKEEAIQAARNGAKEYAFGYLGEDEGSDYLEKGSFDVGQIMRPTFSIDGDDIIENIQEQFCEQCGDVAEDWLSDPSPYMENKDERKTVLLARREKAEKQVYELECRIHDVVNDWLTEIGEQPTFWSIQNIGTYTVKEGADKC